MCPFRAALSLFSTLITVPTKIAWYQMALRVKATNAEDLLTEIKVGIDEKGIKTWRDIANPNNKVVFKSARG
jgi:hypothetical protein